jgi:hypothetical protein
LVLLHGAPASGAGGAGSFGARAAADGPPAVSISIEPVLAGAPAELESEPPVVLPGYLLPADGAEEAAHAGG